MAAKRLKWSVTKITKKAHTKRKYSFFLRIHNIYYDLYLGKKINTEFSFCVISFRIYWASLRLVEIVLFYGYSDCHGIFAVLRL